MDMGVLIDASGSIRSHYPDYMNILEKIVQHFPISRSENRFGIVSMVNDKSHVVGFNDYVTSGGFLKSLKTLPEPEGNSNMATSLKTVYDKLISTSRTNVPRTLVVLSDGFKSDLLEDGKNAVQWADKIESLGIKVCGNLYYFVNYSRHMIILSALHAL